ncbi:hypothetical protein BABINDRAFT_177809 [Babjeviella inositovora NRRL Y-12698]|uniref:Uncharacterized protein n=1 Tax=Babjeviella inositovora NRRL Y-12698 TaxID=984486 RepID=A0A1E3QJG7_9ASCO|nr:uncharacterized protein BABINDRAFT_177809 [Babjeviella inositovora NRRL Y-12698]ODQ77843.1 hypothetical protein BABINDRAFT_177809 [Babjeviella inositovora NRRL Y-12698]
MSSLLPQQFFKGTFFPLRGAVFILNHPLFLKHTVTLAIQELALTFFLYFFYALATSSVVAVTTIFNLPTGFGPMVFLVAQFTMFTQSNMVAAWVFRRANQEDLNGMIDAVYSVQGKHAVILKARLRGRFTRARSLPYIYRRTLTNLFRTYFFSLYVPKVLIRFFLNFGIPIIGPYIASFSNCGGVGFGYNNRFMDLSGFNRNQAIINYVHHKSMYYGFGFGASVLDNLPVMGSLLFYSNSVGAALMSCEEMVPN